jgi:small nuclear ribonucleoprotein (snRNP)-like protein
MNVDQIPVNVTSQRPKRKKGPLIQQSLSLAVQSLQGTFFDFNVLRVMTLPSFKGIEIVIELKNDDEIRGIVCGSDEKLNVLLNKITVATHTGRQEKYDEMLVKGKSIRYIHFPPFLNIRSQLVSYLKKTDSQSRKNAPRKIVEKLTSREKRKFDEIVLDNSKEVDEENEDSIAMES